MFGFQLSPAPIENFTLTWEGYLKPTAWWVCHHGGMEIWNAATNSWERIVFWPWYDGPFYGWTYPYEWTVSYTFDHNVEDYIDANGYLYFQVWGQGYIRDGYHKRVDVYTDFVKLEIVPKPIIAVPVDIKPQSCPNPLNVKAKGVLPVAILGTADFDVTQIDLTSIKLEGVSPLRSALEDVATPFEPFVGKEETTDCTTEGADGYLDLTLKFGNQEIVSALGPVTDKEVRVLKLTGNLKPEFGGTPIIGEDVVIILKKK